MTPPVAGPGSTPARDDGNARRWDTINPVSSGRLMLSRSLTSAAAVHDGAVRIVERALALLRERRGVDFSGYRRSTMERRLANRMIAAREIDGDRYLALLEASESEVEALTANLAIKVSRFYRNAATFDVLASTTIPALRKCFGDAPLRVWSAGCALGEEAYSLAMLLREGDSIDATDVDAHALAAARRGEYGRAALGEIPPAFEQEFFEPAGDGSGALAIAKPLRERVRFLQHDLVAAERPPGGPYHLVCCRNVLIYFTRPLQLRVTRLLIDGLAPGGVLCLGEAEWPLDERGQLETIDRRNRIFRRRPHEEAT